MDVEREWTNVVVDGRRMGDGVTGEIGRGASGWMKSGEMDGRESGGFCSEPRGFRAHNVPVPHTPPSHSPSLLQPGTRSHSMQWGHCFIFLKPWLSIVVELFFLFFFFPLMMLSLTRSGEL